MIHINMSGYRTPTPPADAVALDDELALAAPLLAEALPGVPPDQAAITGLDCRIRAEVRRIHDEGVAAGRKQVAAAIRADADDEAQRTRRGCCSHTIETWLREAARIAEGGSSPDPR